MLVMARMPDQTVKIGDKIELVILAIHSDQVVLVIYGPPELLPPDPDRKSPNRFVVALRRDEKVRLGPEIQITLVDIRDDKARLGFECPPELAVHRKEVWEAIRRELGDDLGPLE